jgi:hypothetical protein
VAFRSPATSLSAGQQTHQRPFPSHCAPSVSHSRSRAAIIRAVEIGFGSRTGGKVYLCDATA